MKGYKVEHMEYCFDERAEIIEQCNFPSFAITFYGWSKSDCCDAKRPCKYTVAIFKIKWKS